MMGANHGAAPDTSMHDASVMGGTMGQIVAQIADGWPNEQTLAEMASDPAKRNMISSLQEEAYAAFSAIVDKTAAILVRGGESSTDYAPASSGSGLLTAKQAVRLTLESKQRQQAWQKARELAEMLVIGALINKDNPDWDPADPTTCRLTGESAFLSLLQFDDEEADAPE